MCEVLNYSLFNTKSTTQLYPTDCCGKMRKWSGAGARYVFGYEPSKKRTVRRDFGISRIGFLIPWLTRGDTPVNVPPYHALFVASAVANSNIADFIWPVENEITAQAFEKAQGRHYENIKYVPMNMSFEKLYSNKLGIPVKSNNRLQSNFRPSYGLIFDWLLTPYSHWGWVDVDMVLGDLSRYLTPKLLNCPTCQIISIISDLTMCGFERWVISGQMTVFRKTEWSRTAFSKVPNWSRHIKEDAQFEETRFATNLLASVGVKNLTFIVGQLNDQVLCSWCGDRLRRLIWRRGRLRHFRHNNGSIYCVDAEAAMVHVRSFKKYLKNRLLATDAPDGFELHWHKRCPSFNNCPEGLDARALGEGERVAVDNVHLTCPRF